MIYGPYIDAIEEIRNRIETAMGSGKKLDSSTAMGLKAFKIGERALVEGLSAMPSLVLTDDVSFTETYEMANRNREILATLDFSLILKYPLTNEMSNNRLYNTSNQTGILFLLQKILDVLNETTAQVISPNLTSDAFRSCVYTVGQITTYQNFLACEITGKVPTGFFQINRRTQS